MINDNLILFIISIALIYIFDHKILPTLGVVALNMIQLYINIVLNLSSITQLDAIYAFLFIISMLYGAFMILIAPIGVEKNEDVMV